MRRRVSTPKLPGFAIVDLRRGQCRFPIADDGRSHRFCGAATHGTTSWCPHHLARVTAAPGLRTGGGASLAQHLAGRAAE